MGIGLSREWITDNEVWATISMTHSGDDDALRQHLADNQLFAISDDLEHVVLVRDHEMAAPWGKNKIGRSFALLNGPPSPALTADTRQMINLWSATKKHRIALPQNHEVTRVRFHKGRFSFEIGATELLCTASELREISKRRDGVKFTDQLLIWSLEDLKCPPSIIRTEAEIGVPVFVDQDLGRFVVDVATSYKGYIRVGRLPVELSISTESIGACLSLARDICIDVNERICAASQFAADQLLSLKNDSWLGDAEQKLSPRQFIDQLQIQTIQLISGDWATFWFDDGDTLTKPGLFGGHGIAVEYRRGKFIDAELFG